MPLAAENPLLVPPLDISRSDPAPLDPPVAGDDAPAAGVSLLESRAADESADGELVAAILEDVKQRLAGERLPVATYRLQFTGQFGFRQAEELVDYLDSLGITDLYASPLLQAGEQSTSGYDVADCTRLSDELGTAEDFERLAVALRERGMGLVLDVVPNHMTTASARNRWWLDVLENGPLSKYASFFDIDWMPLKPDLAYKVLWPVLGDQYGQALETGQLTLTVDQGTFWLQYYQARFPLYPGSYATILAEALPRLEARLTPESPDVLELHSIVTAARNLPPPTETAPERVEEYRREKELIKRRLAALVERCPPAHAALEEALSLFAGQPGDARSFDRLDELLRAQCYRLAHWRVAADEINYRRFFDVNELAAICVENPEVFSETHALIFDLVERGLVTGLRVDHPDGLFDPRAYFGQVQERRLLQLCRQAAERIGNSPRGDEFARLVPQLVAAASAAPPDSPLARPLFIAVEKILGHGEVLRDDWPVHGTVGYEFLNRLGGLLVDRAGESSISSTYVRFTKEPLDFRTLSYRCKRLIVRMSMVSELHVLGHRLDRISERNRWTRDFTLNSLTRALEEVAACFPVYRTYLTPDHIPEGDRHYIEAAVARAKRHNRAMSASVFDFVRDALLLRYRREADDAERRAQWLFAGKFQQLTGPVMAKGIEDTAFYRFNRLVSLNEVGGQPDRFGDDVATFHRHNAARLPRHAHGLSSTSTHDTKRSEDVRARISVLSEVPGEWRKALSRWARANRRLRRDIEGQVAPSANDEYLLYQTLIGVWPGSWLAQGGDAGSSPAAASGDRAAFIERIQQYLVKVVREAKASSSWISPNEAYERAVTDFVAGAISGERPRFLAEIDAFASIVADHGRWNSLTQVLLKVASPGAPDFYQGSELWSLDLVDPDNRRPVDFAARRRLAREILERAETSEPHQRQTLLDELIRTRADGRIKLFVTLLALQARRAQPELFTQGEYLPLTVHGSRSDHLVAVARRHAGEWALAVAPRLTAKLCGFGGPPPIGQVWEDSHIELPPEFPTDSAVDVFSLERLAAPDGRLDAARLLDTFPLAMLVAGSGR